MHLDIITPDEKAFSGEITAVKVPGTKGSFEVLNNHAAIVSSLEVGEVRVRTSAGEELFFVVDGGVIEVLNNKVTLLAEAIREGKMPHYK